MAEAARPPGRAGARSTPRPRPRGYRSRSRPASGDTATTDRLLDRFFLPYLAIRNRKAGYAVSIVKAGAAIVGRPAGPVRAPLVDCTPAEVEDLRALVEALGPQ